MLSILAAGSSWAPTAADKASQDNEHPVHRVWVDEFLLAACQVTNAEYARFLRATGNPPPPFWNDPNFNHPEQPVVAVSWFEAVKYCEWLAAADGSVPPPAYRSRMGARRPRRS